MGSAFTIAAVAVAVERGGEVLAAGEHAERLAAGVTGRRARGEAVSLRQCCSDNVWPCA